MRILMVSVFALHMAGYVFIRLTQTEIWEKDGQNYVHFPESPIAVYYLYRPLSYLDSRATGIN